ncbi:hypothetical protein GCM10022393_14330 [Aquimarina addita]|uniref:DUF4258 domain-containing protein n=1 Tax=Aquimarina addita TaxID=870485 RepID=A0ABP7XG54_9FLAO
MSLLKRIAYYLGGFAIGLIILFFFLDKKETTFDYGFDARVLKNIRIKKRQFSEKVIGAMKANNIDTADISDILVKGDVDFSKSNTTLDSCKTYFIEGVVTEKKIGMVIENCDSIAKINTLVILK